jgi:SAM-dependent methyltransferase
MHLREHDIRPEAMVAEQQLRFSRDRERLLRGAARFVHVRCPACDHDAPRKAFDKLGVHYDRCADCGTIYVNPRPNEAQLAEYYATSENYAYWNEVMFPASEAVRRERIFKPRVDRVLELCARHNVKRERLLEVGAGFGTFLEELSTRDTFAHVSAIEPTPALAATCRTRGLDVIEARVETAEPSVQADVVVSFEVIEHASEPAAFIAACKRWLAPGGLLILTCPNARGFDIEVLGPGSPAIDFEHLNYFHPRSLATLLQRQGMHVLEHATPGALDADIVRNRVLAGEHVLGDPFLQRVLIDEWDTLGAPFQRFLAENGLSSHMWMVAR